MENGGRLRRAESREELKTGKLGEPSAMAGKAALCKKMSVGDDSMGRDQAQSGK